MTSFIGMYNVTAYASSKGGVLQMTKAFSNELAEKNIQVNCICPGYVLRVLQLAFFPPSPLSRN